MNYKLDENTLWILGILALVFFLFPQKNIIETEKKIEEEKKIEGVEKAEYIYKRKVKERRRLVY